MKTPWQMQLLKAFSTPIRLYIKLAIPRRFLNFSKNKVLNFGTKLDKFLRFNDNRPLYFTSMLQAALVGYITHLITNSKLQKEADSKDAKIENLTKENQELKDTHQSEIVELNQAHKNEIVEQSNAAKAIIDEQKSAKQYLKHKKNAYKDALNGSVCLWKKPPIMRKNDIMTVQDETATMKSLS